MASDNLTRIKQQGLDIEDVSSALGLPALEQRVTDLEEGGASSADIEQLKTDVGNLQTGLGTTNQNVANLQTSQTTQDGQISTLQTNVGALQTSQTTQDGQISDLENDVDILQTDVADLKQKVDNAEIILGTINLPNANVTQEALTARASELGYATLQKGYVLFDLDDHEWVYNGTAWADTGAAQAISVATNQTAGIVKGSSDDLKITYDTTGVGQVNGLSTALSGKASQSDMTQAQTDIDTLQTDLGNLQTTVSGHTTTIGTIQRDLSDVNDAVDALETSQDAQDTAIGNLETTVYGHTSQLSTLSGNLSDLSTTVTQQGAAISSLQTAVAGKQEALTAGDGISLSGTDISLDLTQLLAHLVVAETLTGTPNGSTKSFTLANTPVKILAIERDGQTLYATEDFTTSGTTVTFATAPATGSRLKVTYWK